MLERLLREVTLGVAIVNRRHQESHDAIKAIDRHAVPDAPIAAIQLFVQDRFAFMPIQTRMYFFQIGPYQLELLPECIWWIFCKRLIGGLSDAGLGKTADEEERKQDSRLERFHSLNINPNGIGKVLIICENGYGNLKKGV